jgi:hypothetical protein
MHHAASLSHHLSINSPRVPPYFYKFKEQMSTNEDKTDSDEYIYLLDLRRVSQRMSRIPLQGSHKAARAAQYAHANYAQRVSSYINCNSNVEAPTSSTFPNSALVNQAGTSLARPRKRARRDQRPETSAPHLNGDLAERTQSSSQTRNFLDCDITRTLSPNGLITMLRSPFFHEFLEIYLVLSLKLV